MEDNLTQQILNVRSQISNVFSNPSTPVSIPSNTFLPKFFPPKCLSHRPIGRYPKPKEYLSLPTISIHRNPMSFVSERDMHKQNSLARKKNVSKGLMTFNLPVIGSDDEKNWDRVISTCTDLIKNKQTTVLN